MCRWFCTCVSTALGWISRSNIGGESICAFSPFDRCYKLPYTELYQLSFPLIAMSACFLAPSPRAYQLLKNLCQSYIWTFCPYTFNVLFSNCVKFRPLLCKSNLYFPFYILCLHGFVSHLLGYWPFSEIYFWENYIYSENPSFVNCIYFSHFILSYFFYFYVKLYILSCIALMFYILYKNSLSKNFLEIFHWFLVVYLCFHFLYLNLCICFSYPFSCPNLICWIIHLFTSRIQYDFHRMLKSFINKSCLFLDSLFSRIDLSAYPSIVANCFKFCSIYTVPTSVT